MQEETNTTPAQDEFEEAMYQLDPLLNLKFERTVNSAFDTLTTTQKLLLQYKLLRINFQKVVVDILGENYYNYTHDVNTCDEQICSDLSNAHKKQTSISKIAKTVSIISILGNIGLIAYHIWR